MSKQFKMTTVKTEDTGKIFERAIYLAYNIPYDGKYKYGLEEPSRLAPRLARLTELFPPCTHTAKRGARYDYTAVADTAIHLSAKTTKKDGKVAPQVVGQAQPAKFCETLGLPVMTVPELKKYIQEHIKEILPMLCEYTLACPNIYYNKTTDTIRYITLISTIPWGDYTYTWTCAAEAWGNSSTCKIRVGDRDVSLLEVQFHSASRTNMAVRWCFEEFLTVFAAHLNIVSL